MSEIKELSFECFSNIFSNNSEINQSSEWFTENQEHYSKNGNDSHVWDYNAYIRRLNALITEGDLHNNVVLKKLTEAEIIPENNSEYLVKYKICISNLIIRCGFGGNAIFHPLGISEKIVEGSRLEKDEYKGGIYLSFENVTFLASEKNGNHYFQIVLGTNARSDFSKCIFNDVDISLSAQEECNYVYFYESEFKSRHITISGGSLHEKRMGHGSNYYSISPEIISRKVAAKRLTRKISEDKNNIIDSGFLNLLQSVSKDQEVTSVEKYLHKKIDDDDVEMRDVILYLMSLDQRLDVDQSDVHYSKENTAVICFKDCEISDARISGRKIYFIGKNVIEKISNASNPKEVYFGPYNILDKSGVNIRSHHPIFVARKEYATRTNDRSLELISNRELLRIERHILREERGKSSIFSSPSLKDSFVLWFNDKSNDFGMNWVRPILLILLSNLIFSTVLFNSLGYKLDLSLASIFNTIGVFMELLLPINRVGTVLGIDELNKGWEGLSILKNIATSVFLYQAVVAFRKYGKK